MARNNYKLSLLEQETIITFDQDGKTANFYTASESKRQAYRKFIKSLRKENQELIKLNEDSDYKLDFDFPKSWIAIKQPKKLTKAAQAQLIAARKKKNFTSKLVKSNRVDKQCQLLV